MNYNHMNFTVVSSCHSKIVVLFPLVYFFHNNCNMEIVRSLVLIKYLRNIHYIRIFCLLKIQTFATEYVLHLKVLQCLHCSINWSRLRRPYCTNTLIFWYSIFIYFASSWADNTGLTSCII